MPLTNKRGIFALTDVRMRQNGGYWPTSPSSIGILYGYFGGGYDGASTLSTIDRIDYANDTATASVRGPLSVARFGSTATGNQYYGYWGGSGTTDRVDYSNDTATSLSKGPLTTTRTNLGATGNTSYGYFGGGGPGTISLV